MCKHIVRVNRALETEASINMYTVLSINTKAASERHWWYFYLICILMAGSINCIYNSIQ